MIGFLLLQSQHDILIWNMILFLITILHERKTFSKTDENHFPAPLDFSNRCNWRNWCVLLLWNFNNHNIHNIRVICSTFIAMLLGNWNQQSSFFEKNKLSFKPSNQNKDSLVRIIQVWYLNQVHYAQFSFPAEGHVRSKEHTDLVPPW